jgi:hypothetical protein
MNGDDLERAFYRDWEAGKVRRVSDGKRMVPEREWVALTDDEIAEIGKLFLEGNRMLPFSLARAIEAKLKEKNSE